MRDLIFIAFIVPLLGMAVRRPYVGVLLWSWISFMSPHREVWGFASTLPWAQITFLVILLGCVVAREPKRLPLNAVTIQLVLFAIGVTLTSLVALNAPSVVWGQWDRVIKIIAGVLLTAALLSERERVHALIWMIVISLGYFGVKGGIFTVMTGGGFRVVGPSDSIIADRNHLATALLTCVPLMNYLRLQSRYHVVRIGLAAAMVCTVFSAIGSQSRGALVALAATVLVFWARSRGKVGSAIALSVLVLPALAFMPETWVARMQTIREYEEDASAMGRLRVWEAAWRIALGRPLTGAGFRGMYSQEIVNQYAPGITARATHSIWFEPLGEHGFVVFAIWFGIIVAGMLYSVRIVRMTHHRPDCRWAYDLARMSQVSVVAYAAGGTFLSLQYWDVLWTLMATLGATHNLVAHSVSAPVVTSGAADRGWRARAATSQVEPVAVRGRTRARA